MESPNCSKCGYEMELIEEIIEIEPCCPNCGGQLERLPVQILVIQIIITIIASFLIFLPIMSSFIKYIDTKGNVITPILDIIPYNLGGLVLFVNFTLFFILSMKIMAELIFKLSYHIYYNILKGR